MTILRAGAESDHEPITRALAEWWTVPSLATPEARRERAALVPRLWLQHFGSSCLIAERGDQLVGFLIGFHSADRPDESYIHFVGVRPDQRRTNLGRTLYERFFDECRRRGRSRVRCITSPTNEVSIAFHRAMGFSIEPGSARSGDVDVKTDYDGPGLDRVAFVLELERTTT